MGFNKAFAKDEICLYVLVCKHAHDILFSEENKEQNTQLQNNFGRKYLHMHKNVKKAIDILYIVLVFWFCFQCGYILRFNKKLMILLTGSFMVKLEIYQTNVSSVRNKKEIQVGKYHEAFFFLRAFNIQQNVQASISQFTKHCPLKIFLGKCFWDNIHCIVCSPLRDLQCMLSV